MHGVCCTPGRSILVHTKEVNRLCCGRKIVRVAHNGYYYFYLTGWWALPVWVRSGDGTYRRFVHKEGGIYEPCACSGHGAMASAEDLEGFAFSSRRPLGVGPFGKVLLGSWNRKTVAAKVFSTPVDDEGDGMKTDMLCSGVKALWSKLRLLPKHENVAEFVGVAGLSIRQPSLVRNLNYSMTLAGRANLEPRVEQRQRIDIASDIVSGLAFLHSQNIIHGRLSSSNVLLTDVSAQKCNVSISDAALYTVYEDIWGYGDDVRMKWLTPYVSPELESSKAYVATRKSDVFACGLVILAMEVCREPPSLITSPRSKEAGSNEMERHACDLATLEDTNPLKDVIIKCIQQESYMRPSSDALYKLLQAMKSSDEYIAANAVSRARTQLPAEFAGQSTEADPAGGSSVATGRLEAEWTENSGMPSDRGSVNSDYSRLVHREVVPMVVSKSMISLTDDGSVTGGPSLASDGGSVPFDLPKLLGQVRTQLDSLRRSILIVAHDMDDVRGESQSAHRQAWSAHQAAMAAREEASGARAHAATGSSAAQGALEEATKAHREASAAKDTSLRILSALSASAVNPLTTRSSFGHMGRDSTSIADIQEHELISAMSDRGSVGSIPSMLPPSGVAMDEAPPGYIEQPIATNPAMEPPPGMASLEASMPATFHDEGLTLLTMRELNSAGGEPGIIKETSDMMATPGRKSVGYGDGPHAKMVHTRTTSSMLMERDDVRSLRHEPVATAAAFLAHVRRFDFAVKCALSAQKAYTHDRHPSTDREDSMDGEDVTKLRRAISSVFELALRSPSQAFPFGEWVSKVELPLQLNGRCHLCVHNDVLYLVSREILNGEKKTYMVSTTDLEKWVDVKLPSCAVTCHALFSYGSHLYMCASSSDKTDRRSKARGDVVWRLEDNGGDWTRVTQMPHVQWHYGAALDGSRVIFAGGWNGKGEVSHVVVYDLNLGKWLDQLSPLPVPSFGAQSFVTNECFYFVGGSTRHSDLGEVFYLHLSPHSPSYNQWRSIHNPQATCGSCLVNHKIVTIGGWDNSLKQAYNTVHLFDADNSEWLMLPSLRVARVRPEVIYFKQKLVCLSGSVSPSRDSDKVRWMEVLTLLT